MKWNKLKFAGLAASVLLAGLLSACGGSGTTSGTASGGAAQDNSPLQVNIMTILLNPTPPSDDNAIKKLIEEATNARLNIQWVSSNSYKDKLNVTLASGDIPELTYIDEPFSPVFRSMAKQGAFWDVTDYIKDYPNLSSKISKTAWDLTKMEDGRNYSIPRPRPSEADSFFIVRKDWLDNLGLKPPTTVDELYQVMKAFVENDPDKNGKKDTIGLAGNVNLTDMGTFGNIGNSLAGINGNWKWVDNKMVYKDLLPEERKSLEYVIKMNQEKLIPEDFASLKGTQLKDMFKAGKAGIIVDKAGTMMDYITELKKTVPTIKETDFYPLTSLNGFNPKGPGYAGVLTIPKTVPEAKMKRILKLLDTWMNDDVFAIQTYGIEGVDHTVKDGVKVVDQAKLNEHGGPDFNQIVYVADPYASSTKSFFSKEADTLFRKIQDDRAKSSVADISIGLYSPTAQQVLPEFQKNLQDLKTKIILGREPIAAWDAYVEKMRNDPNIVKMSEEMTEAYKKRNGIK
ncbi:extracellular solute-binding protein [Paenibacillus sp. y28]|uniref:extracellular solute-binding protein n=1 Tax=Paenibacillus sp. y28 TaxID=3129110 RepID=UPI00301729A4